MKGKQIKTVLICVASTVAVSGFAVVAGASNFNTDIPSAGMAVALNNYFQEDNTTQSDILGLLNTTQTQPETQTETQAQTQTQTEEAASFYDTVAISQVNDYVNVRSGPSTDAEIVGKIYNNCAATIIGQEGDWYQIQSGNVSGYIKSEYFITGAQAEAKAREVGYVNATVTTMTLNVRESQAAEGRILTQLPEGGVYDVIEYGDGWVYLNIDNDIKGWVSTDYVKIDVDFATAITLEEEKAKQEEEARLAAEAKAAEEKAAAAAKASKKSTSKSSSAASSKISYDSSSSASLRQAVVAYAMQFKGNPYVYGGTSLTNGTDCSGFTMSVYKYFGYSLPHQSGSQAGSGVSVSLDSLQPGDLLFYSNGGKSIGHVGLYIGNGQIIHASTEKTGIIVSNAFYRTPICARRIIN